MKYIILMSIRTHKKIFGCNKYILVKNIELHLIGTCYIYAIYYV